MILLILNKQNENSIELLIDEDMDLSLITENVDRLFSLSALIDKAMINLFADHSKEFAQYKELTDKLKTNGVVGYPVTAMVNAKLYALDKKIEFEELEIKC